MQMGKVMPPDGSFLKKCNLFQLFFFDSAVDFDHFQILRAIGKGAFGKVRFNFVKFAAVRVY